jgi:hypothetical protein
VASPLDLHLSTSVDSWRVDLAGEPDVTCR